MPCSYSYDTAAFCSFQGANNCVVKCQNLCHLICHFMSFNLSFYFKLLAISNPLCSLASHCCYCLATTLPSFSVHVISHTPLSLPTCQQNCPISVPFAQFLTPLVYSYTTSYQHTLHSTLPLNKFPNIKLFFPRRFSLSAF